MDWRSTPSACSNLSPPSINSHDLVLRMMRTVLYTGDVGRRSKARGRSRSLPRSVAEGRAANAKGERNEARALEIVCERKDDLSWVESARTSSDIEDSCGWDVVLEVVDEPYAVGIQVKSSKGQASEFLKRARRNGHSRLPTAVIVVNRRRTDDDIWVELRHKLECARRIAQRIWIDAPDAFVKEPGDWALMFKRGIMEEVLTWYAWRARLGAASHRRSIISACRQLACSTCGQREGKPMTLLIRDSCTPPRFGIGYRAQQRMRESGNEPTLAEFLAEVSKHRPICRRCVRRLQKAAG